MERKARLGPIGDRSYCAIDRFDKTADLATGFRTKAVLAMAARPTHPTPSYPVPSLPGRNGCAAVLVCSQVRNQLGDVIAVLQVWSLPSV